MEEPQGNQCGKSHKETVWEEPLGKQCEKSHWENNVGRVSGKKRGQSHRGNNVELELHRDNNMGRATAGETVWEGR